MVFHKNLCFLRLNESGFGSIKNNGFKSRFRIFNSLDLNSMMMMNDFYRRDTLVTMVIMTSLDLDPTHTLFLHPFKTKTQPTQIKINFKFILNLFLYLFRLILVLNITHKTILIAIKPLKCNV